MIAPRASSAIFHAFVEQVIARWSDADLVLVLDNASYHKAAALRHWLAHQAPRVTVFWLPTYTPHLNLIERVWRFLKSRLACHHYWNNLDGLVTFAETIITHTRATFDATTPLPHIRMVQDLCTPT